MIDPLAEVVGLLQPALKRAKAVGAASPWRIRRADLGEPFYCVVLEGSCLLTVDGHHTVTLEHGDFVLIPAIYGFTMSSPTPPPAGADSEPVHVSDGKVRVGTQDGPLDTLLLVGHCVFGSPDASLLVSLLPQLMHVRGDSRLATLVQLVADEYRTLRPAREVILSRLLEVLLIEALRSSAGTALPPGLLRGLADERLARAIHDMHERPALPWTVAQLAKQAALSRSAFFARFQRALGVAPMAYLLTWRMALGKDFLRRHEGGIAEVAQRVGYSSASAFSVAFTRHVGLPPARYARDAAQARAA
ncbi:MAG: AraC family transcriptional regulator [Pseudomonadota bacterium]